MSASARLLLVLGIAAMACGVGHGAGLALGWLPGGAHQAAAAFLGGFGLLKLGLGLRAWGLWRAGGDPQAIAGQPTVTAMRLWILFRLLVAVLALAGATYIAAHPKPFARAATGAVPVP